MKSYITPERIQEMKAFLKEHPVDHKYDEAWETFGAEIPIEQQKADLYTSILKDLGEIPNEITLLDKPIE